MSLKILVLEEEPEVEIQHIPLSVLVEGEEDALDPELPDGFLDQDELDDIQESATALESLTYRIGCEGMQLSYARELEAITPGFMRSVGGHRLFTDSPSLEGLSETASTVKNFLVTLFKKIRDFVVSMYKRFIAWITSRSEKEEAVEIKAEVEEFLASRRNRDAVVYISSLPDTPEESADEVARFMDGDTKEFATRFIDQLQSVARRIENVEKTIVENPTHFRLARGSITVEELFKEDADSAVNAILKKATMVADKAMKARSSDELLPILEEVGQVAEELKAFEKDMIVNDEASSQYGDDKATSFENLYDNVQTAVKALERVDVRAQADNMRATLAAIVTMGESTHNDEVMEMMPEDASDEQRNAYGQKIISLYRQIAKVGADVLRLWKIRYNAIATINQLLVAMIGIVDNFEKAVMNAGAMLTPEQKAQLAKALASKGLKIIF